MRLRLTIEYDGSRFRGWATQPNLRTVEGVVRDALGWVYDSWERLAVAGRTDTGVHALGQVASVDVQGGPPVERAAVALNTALPDDVSVITTEEAAPDFHARHSARARSYRYRIWRRSIPSPFEQHRSWWFPHELDYEALADVRGPADRRARLPGVHADGDAAQGLPPYGALSGVVRPGRRARAGAHGERVPAPHGADPRRNDARTAPQSWSDSCAARPGTRPAPPLRPRASTSSGSSTRTGTSAGD